MAGDLLETSGRGPVRRQSAFKKRPLSIRTDIPNGEGLSTSGLSSCSKYVRAKREMRAAQGTKCWVRCLLFFIVSVCFVFVSPLYSHLYYFSWVVCLGSFLSILPSVLPSDNTKINFLIGFAFVSTLCVFCFCIASAVRQYFAYTSGECVRLTSRRLYCKWDIFFWSFHGALTLFLCLVWRRAICTLRPAQKLKQFWRISGYYFVAVGTISIADKAVFVASSRNETRNTRAANRIFWWNMVITVEEFLIGGLCLSSRCRAWFWSRAASYGDVNAVDDRQTSVFFSLLVRKLEDIAFLVWAPKTIKRFPSQQASSSVS